MYLLVVADSPDQLLDWDLFSVSELVLLSRQAAGVDQNIGISCTRPALSIYAL